MTDEAAMRAAVIDRPDDDTPRLVFADWLDDHGRPEHATFIRAQVAAAAEGRHELDTYCDYVRWRDQAKAEAAPPDVWGLLADWVFPLAAWRRGFLDRVELPFDAWEAHAAAMRSLHPVRRVTLTTTPPAGVMTRRGSTLDEKHQIIDQWHESDRWPGVRFDLPRDRLSMAEFYMRYAVEQVEAAQRARNLLAHARFPQVDFRPMMAAFEQTARVFQGYSEAVTAAAIPAVRQLLQPLARSAAALQPVATRADRRKRRRGR